MLIRPTKHYHIMAVRSCGRGSHFEAAGPALNDRAGFTSHVGRMADDVAAVEENVAAVEVDVLVFSE